MSKNVKAATLQQVNEFLASDRATEEKVDRLVNFLADEIDEIDALDDSEQQVLLSQAQVGDPVAQEIENTKAQQEELLKKPGGSTLLEEDAAAMEEDVAAFLADTEQRHKDDKEHKKDDKVASELGRNSGAHVDHAPKALALEATTETQQQLPSAITLSSQQESTVPHMIFGGAFLLVAAVLLTAMTKRARAPAKPHASKDDAYAYYLHQ